MVIHGLRQSVQSGPAHGELHNPTLSCSRSSIRITSVAVQFPPRAVLMCRPIEGRRNPP
jgi:hypothetical protein